MPKSGKTTIFNIVNHYLKRQGYLIEEFHGGGRYSPIDKSAITSLNIYLACRAVDFILISSAKEKVHHRVYLMDRGLFDRMLFTRALELMEKIDRSEAEAISHFLS